MKMRGENTKNRINNRKRGRNNEKKEGFCRLDVNSRFCCKIRAFLDLTRGSTAACCILHPFDDPRVSVVCLLSCCCQYIAYGI